MSLQTQLAFLRLLILLLVFFKPKQPHHTWTISHLAQILGVALGQPMTCPRLSPTYITLSFFVHLFAFKFLLELERWLSG